jgi:membrane-associated phospholipid phosphatase
MQQASPQYPAHTAFAAARPFILLLVLWAVGGGIALALEEDRGYYTGINQHPHPVLDAILPYVTFMGEAAFIVPVLLVLLLFKACRNRRIIIAFAVCNLVPFIVTQIVKNLINAPRPLKYFNEAAWIHRVEGQPVNYNYSFPSGHSEGSFALFCFLSLVLPAKYAGLSIFFFLLAAAVGFSRIYLSQHFFADVYVGSLIGAGFCLLCFRLVYSRKKPVMV